MSFFSKIFGSSNKKEVPQVKKETPATATPAANVVKPATPTQQQLPDYDIVDAVDFLTLRVPTESRDVLSHMIGRRIVNIVKVLFGTWPEIQSMCKEIKNSPVVTKDRLFKSYLISGVLLCFDDGNSVYFTFNENYASVVFSPDENSRIMHLVNNSDTREVVFIPVSELQADNNYTPLLGKTLKKVTIHAEIEEVNRDPPGEVGLEFLFDNGGILLIADSMAAGYSGFCVLTGNDKLRDPETYIKEVITQ